MDIDVNARAVAKARATASCGLAKAATFSAWSEQRQENKIFLTVPQERVGGGKTSRSDLEGRAVRVIILDSASLRAHEGGLRRRDRVEDALTRRFLAARGHLVGHMSKFRKVFRLRAKRHQRVS